MSTYDASRAFNDRERAVGSSTSRRALGTVVPRVRQIEAERWAAEAKAHAYQEP